MTKILITGAGGFVGTHLIKELQTDPSNEIYGAVYSPTSDISSLLPSDHIIAGDLTDFTYAESLVKTVQPEVIYHLAALSVVHNSTSLATKVMNGNTTISYNLLEAVRLHASTARFIAICSANVYGAVQDASVPLTESTPFRPLNPYAVSKITQEMLALQYHLAHQLDVVILRPFNHTGVGQTTDFVIPSLVKQFVDMGKTGETELRVGNLDNVRDFTDVRDMVKAYVLAAKKCVSGEAYNLGSGVGHSIREIITLLEELTGIKVTLKTSDDLTRASDVPILISDSSKFCSLTAWSPSISLKETLSAILDNYRR